MTFDTSKTFTPGLTSADRLRRGLNPHGLDTVVTRRTDHFLDTIHSQLLQLMLSLSLALLSQPLVTVVRFCLSLSSLTLPSLTLSLRRLRCRSSSRFHCCYTVHTACLLALTAILPCTAGTGVGLQHANLQSLQSFTVVPTHRRTARPVYVTHPSRPSVSYTFVQNSLDHCRI